MDRIKYSKESIDNVKQQVQELIKIVNSLETQFPGRHFTLDGHLVGSIGEVMAAYYYGIELYTASARAHDGEIDGKKVQIKISQQDNIVINHEPEYLIVLYLNKSGTIYEVYNGPGKEPWETASKRDSHNNRHMLVNKLMQLDATVKQQDRIQAIHEITKMKPEFKNKKRSKTTVNKEKISILQNLITGKGNESAYYDALDKMGDLKTDYARYMQTSPIDCDEELKRLPDADYELCSALLTMLLRADHFDNGSFERRMRAGEVLPILERMIRLLEQNN